MLLGTTDLQKHKLFESSYPLEKKELEGFQYKYSFKELESNLQSVPTSVETIGTIF